MPAGCPGVRPVAVEIARVPGEAAAEVWIIKTQFGRRNLSAYQRSVLQLRIKPLLAAQAKERSGNRTDLKPNLAAGSKQTRDELAELAGVGHTTVDKVAYIQEHGTDETKATSKPGQKKSPRLGAEWLFHYLVKGFK